MALFRDYPGGWASTRKVKPIWILLKQETVSGSGISWAIMQVCTSLQTDNYASTPPLSFFTGRMPFLSPNQQRQSTEGPLDHPLKLHCIGNNIKQVAAYTVYYTLIGYICCARNWVF